MAYSDLLPNQYITFGNANTCGFPILHPLPLATQGQQFMTKDDVLYYLNVVAANLNVLTSGSQFPWKALLASGRTKGWRAIYPYCIQDGRPTGLQTRNIKYAYYTHGNVYFQDGTYIITTEKAYATGYQYDGAFDCSYYGSSSGQTYAVGFDAQAAGWTIGNTIYLGTDNSTEKVPDGWYVIDQAYVAPDYRAYDTAHHIVGGVVTDIQYSPW